MIILDLFAGIGGFSLAGHWAGHDTAAFIEKDPFCQQVLKKNFAGVPIYGDIKEFDGTRYARTVDIICGGFPCQPFSVAGKRKGTDDDRHLWPQMLRVIREVKPTWVIGENVGGFLTIGEGLVFEQTCLDLEAEGYEVQAFVIPAVAVNAPHRRDRVWIVANRQSEYGERGQCGRDIGGKSERSFRNSDSTSSYSDIMRPQEQGAGQQAGGAGQSDEDVINSKCGGQSGNTRRGPGQKPEDGYIRAEQVTPDTVCSRQPGQGQHRQPSDTEANGEGEINRVVYAPNFERDWVEVATELCRVDDGLPVRLDGFELSKSGHRRERLKSLGNSIVPQVAYEVFKAINEAST